MHIAAVCPRCESRYQLDESLRGKRMRCPNPLCKIIFEVRAESDQPTAEVPKPSETAPPEKLAPTVTGSVTDLLQVLSAEMAAPAPPAVKQQPAAPPPVKKPRPPVVAEPVAPAPAAWQQLPPPVRSAAATLSPQAPAVDLPDDFPGDDDEGSKPAIANGAMIVGP